MDFGVDGDVFCEAIGITPQQFRIVQTVYDLQETGLPASPKSIQEHFGEDGGRRIQRSNLSAQIRVLLERGILTKRERGCVVLDREGVCGLLEHRRKEMQQTISAYRQISNRAASVLSKSLVDRLKPTVSYLEQKSLFKRLTELCEQADEYYVTTRFPSIFKAARLVEGTYQKEYVDLLDKRCLDGDLRVNYLTRFDVDSLLGDILSAFKDSKTVVSILREVLSNLEAFPEKYGKNLGVYYMDFPFGLDIALPISGGEANSFVLFMREEVTNAAATGVFVESKPLAQKMSQLLFKEFASAKKLSGKEKVFEEIKKDIGRILQRVEKKS